MVEHRKNVPRTSYVPSSWFIVLTVMVCLGGAGWIGWLLVGDDATTAGRSASPGTTTSASPQPTTSASPKPTRTTPTAAEPERTTPVAVLNNTGITGAAKAYTAKVARAGWPLGGIGNWNGSIEANTVYFPPQLAAEGALLAEDLGITRVRPSVAPMATDRLTVILSGPQ